jgi:hypothetical protein
MPGEKQSKFSYLSDAFANRPDPDRNAQESAPTRCFGVAFTPANG